MKHWLAWACGGIAVLCVLIRIVGGGSPSAERDVRSSLVRPSSPAPATPYSPVQDDGFSPAASDAAKADGRPRRPEPDPSPVLKADVPSRAGRRVAPASKSPAETRAAEWLYVERLAGAQEEILRTRQRVEEESLKFDEAGRAEGRAFEQAHTKALQEALQAVPAARK